MSNLNIYIPYADYAQMTEDSAKLKAITSILTTEFPDDTCQLIAIKSVLGLPVTEEEEPTDPTDPVDPPTTDPIDPDPGTDPSDPDPTDPPTP